MKQDIDKIIHLIDKSPSWLVFIVYAIIIFIFLKIYFKFFYWCIQDLTEIKSVQTANERLFLNKVMGNIFLFFSFIIVFFLSLKFTIWLPKIFLYLMWFIQLAFTFTSYPLFDHIISLKYTPHLLKEKEYFSLCGEIKQKDEKFILDVPFFEDPINI